jgi:4-amino-4-deoxy-L-arabinose transferase-like glycosyltransferase
VLLAAVVVLAGVARLWAIGNTGLDHFDSGGYALSALAVFKGDVPEGFFSDQILLSPPFFFGASGLIMWALHTSSDKVLIGLSTLMGILTIPLVYLVTYRSFGRAAAAVTSIMLALSDFHILFSRSALTDVMFAFWFLLALWLYSEADVRESMKLAVAAGLATGLAWNTKYHGWLAGVVAFMALLPLLRTSSLRRFLEGFIRLVVAAAVATATYVPWFWYVNQQPGGYESLALNHAHHLRPLRALHHVAVHFQAQVYLDGWLGRLAPALALAIVAIVYANTRESRRSLLVRWLPVFLVLGVVLGEVVFAALLAVGSLGVLVRRGGTHRWIVLAFALLFTLLTPLYIPYTRLLLPWVVAIFMLAGLAVSELAKNPTQGAFGGPSRVRRISWAAGIMALLALCLVIRPPWRSASTFRASDEFRIATAQVAELIPPGSTAPVWGEPAVVFYLTQLGRNAWHIDRPADLYDRLDPGSVAYLVTGIYSGRIPGVEGLRGWLEDSRGAAIEEVGRARVRSVSDERLLNDFRPAEARQFIQEPGDDYDLVVYRVVIPER